MIKLETQYSTDFSGSYREGGSSILFYVENTTNQGAPGEAARIVAGCYESSSSTEYHSYLAFHTSNNSSSTGTNERMVIDDNGYVGIGTTSPSKALSVCNTSYGLHFEPGSDGPRMHYAQNTTNMIYMTIGSYASHNNIISPSVNRELRLGWGSGPTYYWRFGANSSRETVIQGKTNWSHIYYSTNEDWYIRSGKSGGKVVIQKIPMDMYQLERLIQQDIN